MSRDLERCYIAQEQVVFTGVNDLCHFGYYNMSSVNLASLDLTIGRVLRFIYISTTFCQFVERRCVCPASIIAPDKLKLKTFRNTSL